MQDSSDEAQRHARTLAEKEGWWNPFLCLWCTQDSTWSPELRNHPLLRAGGTSLLTDKEAILKRWAEHFDGVLNRPSYINDEAINRLPQVECNPLLDELPTVSEIVKAIKLLSSGKAPGSDAIPAESTKQKVLQLQRNWQSYFTLYGEKKPSLKNSRMQQLSTYSKGKGILVCDNHRGISLLSIAGKILARVLLNRLNEHLERSEILPECQYDSRKTEEQQTWSLQHDSFKKNARNRNRMWTSTWPLST